MSPTITTPVATPDAPAATPTVGAGTDAAGPPRRIAVVGGLSLLAMAVVAVPANLVVLQVSGADGPAAAAAWAGEHVLALRLAVLGLLLAAVLDVVVAWALAAVLRPAGPETARLAGWLRVAYAAMFVAAIGHLAATARAAGAGDAEVLWTTVHAFGDGWQLALAVFGVHLVVLASLLRRVAPPALAGVVGLAGVAYVVDALLRLLVTDPGLAGTVSAGVLGAAGLVGEVWLALWLVLRAGRR